MFCRNASDKQREPDWRPLSETERLTLAKLLTADFPGRTQLLQQAQGALAKTLDAEGSIALRSSVDAPAAQVVRRIPVEAEFEDLDGVTVHVLLHVLEGFLDELEFYRDDSAPIQGPVRASGLRLIVL